MCWEQKKSYEFGQMKDYVHLKVWMLFFPRFQIMKEIDIDFIVFVCLNTINMTLIWILHLCMMNEDVRLYDGNL